MLDFDSSLLQSPTRHLCFCEENATTRRVEHDTQKRLSLRKIDVMPSPRHSACVSSYEWRFISAYPKFFVATAIHRPPLVDGTNTIPSTPRRYEPESCSGAQNGSNRLLYNALFGWMGSTPTMPFILSSTCSMRARRNLKVCRRRRHRQLQQ